MWKYFLKKWKSENLDFFDEMSDIVFVSKFPTFFEKNSKIF